MPNCPKCHGKCLDINGVLKPIITLSWSKDKSLIGADVLVSRLNGREFPAYAVLVDIKDNGEFLSNSKGLRELRKEIIAQLKADELND